MTTAAELFQPPNHQRAVGVVGDSQTLACFVETANTFLTRFVGLQFRLPLRRNHGLLMFPTGSIHTFWMRGPIDVLWLNRDAEVLRVVENLQPWRIRLAPPNTYGVLELGGGTVAAFGRPLLGATLTALDASSPQTAAGRH